MSAPLAGVTPIFALNFWAYDLACQTIRKSRGYAPGSNLSLVEYGVGGAFAAIPTTVGPSLCARCQAECLVTPSVPSPVHPP